MPFKIILGDITTFSGDAIVNAADPSLLGGGGVDGAIHRMAGPGLLKECMTLGGCRRGEAKITGAYSLPCKYIIHTVGPLWNGGGENEDRVLASCYRSSLALAKEHGIRSIAFPQISTGVYGFPPDRALGIATEEITSFLGESDPDMEVFLVVYEKREFCSDRIPDDRLAKYIASCESEYADRLRVERKAAPEPIKSDSGKKRFLLMRKSAKGSKPSAPADSFEESFRDRVEEDSEVPCPPVANAPQKFEKSRSDRLEEASGAVNGAANGAANGFFALAAKVTFASTLEDELRTADESFSETLLRKIDERGMSDSQCYKKANIDRKLFSKIRSDRLYKPSKQTAIAFAIALELSYDEAVDLLRKAGFALSHSSVFDIIVEFFIKNGVYDIFEINEALFRYDQTLLGA